MSKTDPPHQNGAGEGLGSAPETPAPAVILVVEDNPINMKLATVLLESGGYRTAAAQDGAQMERLIEQGLRPAVVLMDVQLPGVSGIELTRRLRLHPEAAVARVPIIAVTGHAMLGDEAEARAAGCVEFVSKPIDTRGLLAVVARWVGAATDPRA